ncbi:hypothetical protein [Pseudolactococcus carnosus]|uniref:hypothetical protein n=1 Tax=Pseudolactococcus carnosus TaxID=2749961 RepID=UPI000BD9BAB4|nr:hypothetical protein [Lactococcus carnosus]SOB47633.1 hypothetical protein LPICM17_380004 [Lactococcus piscium]MCJ1968200.1 hypothetical protein [Lactococcus carnosus]MCJ1988308.1 hypothetical protein [Lactococcus carnosus]MCJ2001346.1 hypothetical protein [Lactococcus carnosus]MCJ2005230.1 hypothetical protein [Lactococcus carnosus]
MATPIAASTSINPPRLINPEPESPNLPKNPEGFASVLIGATGFEGLTGLDGMNVLDTG